MTNWANSFLKIGYNVGLHSNQNQDGVPILRIQKLKPKVVLPPIYKVKYNQFSETKNTLNNNEEESNLVCSKIAQKLFSPSANNYNNLPRNKSKNSFLTQLHDKDNNENENNKKNKTEQKLETSINMNNGLKIENEEQENKIENNNINENDVVEISSNNINEINIIKDNEEKDI